MDHRRAGGWVSVLAVASVLQSVSLAQEAATQPDETHEFILYTGANLKIIDGEELRPVVKVTDSGLFVDVNGEVEMLGFDDIGELWIDREMKLNSVSATIEQMAEEKAYSEGLVRVPIWGTIAAGSYSADRGSLNSSEQGDIQQPHQMSAPDAMSGMNRGPGWKGRPADGRSTAGSDFDAWKVSFDLSTARPLADLYLVLVTDYRDPARPDGVLRRFHLETVDGISAAPRKITLLQEGFPHGFEVENSDVYLYVNGREIPTNLSEKQVALTRDEAMQYLILEYMLGHKDATLPPRPMWVGMPPEVKTMIRESESNPSILLRLDVKGRVISLDLDPASGAGIAPEIIEAVREFRFYPAFENGRPVEGSYSLRPKELVR